MNVLLLHWRSWWARVLSRAEPVATPPPESAGETRVSAPMAASAEDSAAPERTGVDRGRDEEAEAGLLRETLQLAEGGGVAPGRPPADAAARASLQAELRNLRQIPALQSLLRGFQRTMSRTDVAVDEVVTAIGRDAGLCVRVLRLANAVTVGAEQRVDDLATAVQLLGVVRVRKAAQAVFTLRDANRVAEGFDWRHLWVHALATAAIAEELERRLRPARDSQIHFAALLHDVGKIVLSTLAPEDYREVLMRAWNAGGRLEELERERLGVDHREAGLIFARENGLPEIVAQAIAHHAEPAAAEAHGCEVALIALANFLSKAHGLGFSGARLTPADGEWAEQPAWRVVEEACGRRIDAEQMEEELGPFLGELRTELRTLREGN